MSFNEIDWILHKAHHKELIQIVINERLAREAYQVMVNRQDQVYKIANRLKLLVGRLGTILRPSRDPKNAACLPNSTAIYPKKEPGDAKICC